MVAGPRLTISGEALQELSRLNVSSDGEHAIQLFVAGVRCCSPRYGLKLVPATTAGIGVDTDGGRFIVPHRDEQACQDVAIDYVRSDAGEGFVVRDRLHSGCVCAHKR